MSIIDPSIHATDPSFLGPNPSNPNLAMLELSMQSILPHSAVFVNAAVRLTTFRTMRQGSQLLARNTLPILSPAGFAATYSIRLT